MKFLSKLSQVAQTALRVLGVIQPIAQGINPQAGAIVGKIFDFSTAGVSIVKSVELGAAALSTPVSGAEKLKMATPLFVDALLGSAAFAGRKIANEGLFRQGASKIADGFADCTNALHEDEVTKV